MDKCYYIPTDIQKFEIDKQNNILIKFSRPVELNYTALTNRDFRI